MQAPQAATPRRQDARAARPVLLESALKRKPATLQPLLLRTPDGFDLRCALARPVETPRGTLVILPGRGDYIERHYETVEQLLKRRFAVAIFDWRGQGLSQRYSRNRLKGHVRSFADYETDLQTVMRDLVLPDMPAPYYAFAISMGGHILLKASFRHLWFERGMLISPMVDLPPHPRRALLERLARGGAWLGLSRAFFPVLPRRLMKPEDFARNALTSDRKRFLREARFLQDYPEVGIAMCPTFGWLRAALNSIDELRATVAAGGEPRWPLYALAAARDALVDAEALRRLVRQVGNIDATFLHKARHEITIERNENQALMWRAFDSFFNVEEGGSR